ncbi:MAG: hypothetical protein H7A45_10015 [Verrucomicrobiales bacterium]|nr:hypothetical protein [Verrucomicrobiales bacterium]MCP5528609.1 hypothetical protein [Verrucomicrobiales bacterium]
MSGSRWLFVTAAKGLQGYVLRSDPLKEMVGGSELIEQLTRTQEPGFLGKVLRQLWPGWPRPETDEVLTDSSGAARILFADREDACRLARVWPLLAGQYAPGLEVSVAVVEAPVDALAKALKDAEREINVNRNLPTADLPAAGPWVARNRRTGLPAGSLVTPLDTEDREAKKWEPVDDESRRKREAATATAPSTLLRKVVLKEYADLVPDDPKARNKRWPPDLTKLATDDNSYIAVIHADANGLGAAMMACLEHLPKGSVAAATYRQVCTAIEDASVAAAQEALRPLLEAAKRNPKLIVPVRPLVCAGEDFTCVIRARHAVEFAATYLDTMEKKTSELFARLPDEVRGSEDLRFLTGCAGVVFCKSHFPFSRAYALAESLCGYAKRRTERKASAIAFLRLKSSLQPSDDYEAVVRHAFTAGPATDRISLTMNPYVVGGQPGADLPRLADLRELKKALEGKSRREDARVLKEKAVPRSGVRGLVSRAYSGRAAVDKAFERFERVVRERDKAAWEGVEAALQTLTGNKLWKENREADAKDPKAATPIYDALELSHLGKDRDDEDGHADD